MRSSEGDSLVLAHTIPVTIDAASLRGCVYTVFLSRGVLDVARTTAREVREAPIYSAAEAAQYLRLPISTVRAWSFGQGYRVRDEKRRFESVIGTADRKNRRLSFINLVELLVLAAIRRTHRVPLPHVRRAVNFLRKHFPSAHPLADHAFQTNGVGLFVEKFGQILNLSRDGQIEMKQFIDAYLRGVDRDSKGVPIKLHLPRSEKRTKDRSMVVIDPGRGFGRPVLDGTGVRTELIVARFQAGEPIASLAEDYALSSNVIEEVIRSELPLAA